MPDVTGTNGNRYPAPPFASNTDAISYEILTEANRIANLSGATGQHLNALNYSDGNATTIQNACFVNTGKIVRTAGAKASAQAAGKDVIATVLVSANNGRQNLVQVQFAPADLEKTFSTDLSIGGQCTAVWISVQGVIELP